MIKLSELIDWIDIDTKITVRHASDSHVLAVHTPREYDVDSPDCGLVYIEAVGKNEVEVWTHDYPKQQGGVL